MSLLLSSAVENPSDEFDRVPLAHTAVNELDPPKEKRSWLYIPRRWILIALIVNLIFMCYFIRIILSVAILPLSKTYQWDENTKGLMLSSFYWGYITTQIPGGLLAKKYGGKVVLGIGFFVASLFTMLLPLVAEWKYAFLALRIMSGVGEGVSFPSVYTLYGDWLPKSEKTILIAIVTCASYGGTILAMTLSPLIINSLGWSWLFYGTGIYGILSVVPWFLFAKTIPEDPNSWCLIEPSQSEISFIVSTRDKALVAQPSVSANIAIASTDDDDFSGKRDDPAHVTLVATQAAPPPIPWISIWKSPAFLVLLYNHFAINWGFYIFLSWLPTYMWEELGFDIKSGKAVWAMVPYVFCLAITLFSGVAATTLIEKKVFSTLLVRCMFQSLGTFLPAICLILLSCVQFSTYGTLALMSSAIALTGFSNAGVQVNFNDISGKYAGAMFSITNTFATVPGIFGVYITGYILQTTNYNWAIVFSLAAGVYMAGFLLFNLWAKGEQIDFDALERKRLEDKSMARATDFMSV